MVSKCIVIDNLANFLSISPNPTKFCRLFAWSQLDFPASAKKYRLSEYTQCVGAGGELGAWKMGHDGE